MKNLVVVALAFAFSASALAVDMRNYYESSSGTVVCIDDPPSRRSEHIIINGRRRFLRTISSQTEYSTTGRSPLRVYLKRGSGRIEDEDGSLVELLVWVRGGPGEC